MLAFHLGVPEYALTLPLGLVFAAALLGTDSCVMRET
jgi:hypothetical protein